MPRRAPTASGIHRSESTVPCSREPMECSTRHTAARRQRASRSAPVPHDRLTEVGQHIAWTVLTQCEAEIDRATWLVGWLLGHVRSCASRLPTSTTRTYSMRSTQWSNSPRWQLADTQSTSTSRQARGPVVSFMWPVMKSIAASTPGVGRGLDRARKRASGW